MYHVELSEAYFPTQQDAALWDITVGGLLRKIATSSPDAVALVDIDSIGDVAGHWTYAQMLLEAERLAMSLASRFAPGERIVVWAPNIPRWVFMEYACGLAGLVLVTANPSFQAKELRYVLEQSGAVALFLIDEYRGNPMADIAATAVAGNSLIQECVNLEDNDEL